MLVADIVRAYQKTGHMTIKLILRESQLNRSFFVLEPLWSYVEDKNKRKRNKSIIETVKKGSS